MEERDLLKMIQIYKARLADIEEQAIMYQAIIAKQVEQQDVLKEQVQNLETQIKELTGPQE